MESEQPNGDGVWKLFCACQSSLSNHPWYPPVAKLQRLAQNWSFLVGKQRLWSFSARDPLKWSHVCCNSFTAVCGQWFLHSLTPLFRIFYLIIELKTYYTTPAFLRNHFTKILVTTSKIDNHCYRKVLAICVEKPFLKLRQIWLILVKTVIMRSIMLAFLLFVGAFTSVCQWVSHL